MALAIYGDTDVQAAAIGQGEVERYGAVGGLLQLWSLRYTKARSDQELASSGCRQAPVSSNSAVSPNVIRCSEGST